MSFSVDWATVTRYLDLHVASSNHRFTPHQLQTGLTHRRFGIMSRHTCFIYASLDWLVMHFLASAVFIIGNNDSIMYWHYNQTRNTHEHEKFWQISRFTQMKIDVTVEQHSTVGLCRFALKHAEAALTVVHTCFEAAWAMSATTFCLIFDKSVRRHFNRV